MNFLITAGSLGDAMGLRPETLSVPGSDSIVSLGFAFNPFGFKAEAGHGDGSFEVSLWCKTNDYSFSYDMMLPRMVEDEVPKITLLDHQVSSSRDLIKPISIARRIENLIEPDCSLHLPVDLAGEAIFPRKFGL